MGNGESFTQKFWATVWGILIISLAGAVYDIFWSTLGVVRTNSGWSAVGYALAALVALGAFLFAAHFTGLAFVYASRYVSAERKKDRPKETIK